MTVRAPKKKTAKQVSAVDAEIEKSHPLVKSFIEEYRKENVRLQNLIAKNQVAHESEANKIRAEAAEKTKPTFNINLGDVKHEYSFDKNTKS